jgi:hypothetical protein
VASAATIDVTPAERSGWIRTTDLTIRQFLRTAAPARLTGVVLRRGRLVDTGLWLWVCGRRSLA